MSNVNLYKYMKKVGGALVIMLAFYTPFISQVQAADKVTTYKDEKGWKLQVNGSDFYIKGVVWGYIPRDQNYSYNLWAESDEFIRKVLDYDFGLMKAAGVNAIRSFTMIPPRWVTYIYKEHGIMSIVNPLMGRYGHNIGGRWVANIDYSDELTRTTLKRDMMAVVEEYKNTPGVLMFAFGNESNYALSWSSFEIENLPQGERQKAKAKYLYSLWNEVMQAGKRIDSNHPFTIVNGDLQYIDLIAEYCKDMDLLGTNVYRGTGFTDLWKDVKAKLDLPIVLMEFGSDAFNAREFAEDQAAQAHFLKEQWQEMYNKSYGNGEEGNSLGGFVFEWRDEWWKYKVEDVVNLDVHDNHASWASGGYTFDYVEGKNNMNEEWWGITRLGTPNSDGVYTAIPRMAYDVLTKIWRIDPYLYKKAAINLAFNSMNMELITLKSDVRMLKNENSEKKKILSFTGGSLQGEMVLKGSENAIHRDGEEGIKYTDGQMLFMDFGFQPTDKISGQFSLNVLGRVPDKDSFELTYGRRGLPITVVTQKTEDGVTVTGTELLKGRERVEIYDFDATYKGNYFDLNAFYHVPRYHWKYEGDFYGLLREATDIDGPNGMDIWNSKAPEGFEISGKQSLGGFKLLFGPEVYWGANPKVMLKYSSKLGGIDYTFIHAEDVARKDDSSTATQATERQSRQTTLYAKTNITKKSTLELGGIIASGEKAGDKYQRLERGNIIEDDIKFEDTLGVKAKLSVDLFDFSRVYLSANYAGLVADGGEPLKEFGHDSTYLPYTEMGNKKEYEAGIQMNFGNFMIYPRFLYRDNLVDANPAIEPSVVGGVLNPGLRPRNREDDPFAVVDNRKARSAELFFTYDPTGETFFYAWDNDKREDARFAFNIGAVYTDYPTATDSDLFFFEEGGVNAPFGVGLPKEKVWKVSSRIVANPSRNLKLITKLLAGKQQADGDPAGGTQRFYEAEGKFIYNRRHILSGYIKKGAWGPYDFHKQFNITYPYQYKLDYSLLLDEKRDEKRSSKVGVRALYRTLDKNSPLDESENNTNDYNFLTIFYFSYNF